MEIKHLGPIDEGKVSLANLTVFCGGNNQGKTYVSYALYGILETLPNLIEGLFSEQEVQHLLVSNKLTFQKSTFIYNIAQLLQKNLEKNKKDILDAAFQSESKLFEETDITFTLEEFIEILSSMDSVNSMVSTINQDVNIRFKFDEQEISIVLIGDFQSVDLNIEDYQTILNSMLSRVIRNTLSVLYIPAERVGINVFKLQLMENKVETVDMLSTLLHANRIKNKNERLEEWLKHLPDLNASFPKPIQDYLKYINDMKNDDFHGDEAAIFIRDRMVKGTFFIHEATKKSYFRLQHSKKNNAIEEIPLHMTSSSVKSIYGLDYYFEHYNELKRNYLIIDEPEMNLHPTNQVAFAELLDVMIRKGIHVIISTHSDFLIKKIQNIMLKNELQKNSNGLVKENVKIYDFRDGGIHQVNLFDDTAVFDNFNSTIEALEDEYLDLMEQHAVKDSKE